MYISEFKYYRLKKFDRNRNNFLKTKELINTILTNFYLLSSIKSYLLQCKIPNQQIIFTDSECSQKKNP